MGRKIFVSYKYSDYQVENLPDASNSTVRDYVDEFEKLISSSDHIYKGESDDEDLSELSEETIWQKLRDRIYDSSVTVVFISPGMSESGERDRAQWIPWEVSFSLKETSRKNKNGDPVTSRTSAMVAVVLPDKNGSYKYYLEKKECCSTGCNLHYTTWLFQIIRDNKFNLKNAATKTCDEGLKIWYGAFSYIGAVRWCDFKSDYNKHLDAAYSRRDDVDSYNIVKNIS